MSFEVIVCLNEETNSDPELNRNSAVDVKPSVETISQDGDDSCQHEEIIIGPTITTPETNLIVQPVISEPVGEDRYNIETPEINENTRLQIVAFEKVEHFDPVVLKKLLSTSLAGEAILDRAKRGPQSETSQNELTGIIANHHILHGLKSTEKVLESYADAIVCCLKHEIKVGLVRTSLYFIH